MRRTTAVLASCVLGAILALALPAGALAAPALDQYIETLPGAGGDKPSQNGGGGGGGNAGGSSSSTGDGGGSGANLTVQGSELDALEASGEDGAAAAAAAAATAPRVRGAAADKQRRQASSTEFAAVVEQGGRTPVSAVLGAVAGDGPRGIVLPVVLLAVLVVGLALAARRRWGTTGR